MLRSPADRKKFEAEFPRSQMIQKTDLAKYHLTFEARPHIVSLGAQKCFLQYAQEISRKWEQSTKYFNDKFFRQTVAKAIVFRWLDKHVGTAGWYVSDRGYKANIVTYTLAWLADYLARKESSVLDFDLIWKLQSVPEELQTCLAALAPHIAKSIKSPPQGVSNISEYAKWQACWSCVSALEIELKSELSTFVINLEAHKEQSRDAKAVKAVDDEIRFETLLVNNINRLPGVQQVAEQNRLLSPLSIKGLQKARNGNFRLSRSERNALTHLFERLDRIGLGPTSWED